MRLSDPITASRGTRDTRLSAADLEQLLDDVAADLEKALGASEALFQLCDAGPSAPGALWTAGTVRQALRRACTAYQAAR